VKTRITELFGIKYPLLLSGMSWISVPRMVAAVSTPAVWVFWLRDPWTRHKPESDSGNQKTDRQTLRL